jgi:hypothetical protein
MACHTCVFWDVGADYERMKAKSEDQAKCLYNPPRPQMVQAQNALGQVGMQVVTIWPVTGAFNFCHCEETDPECEGKELEQSSPVIQTRGKPN